MTGFIYKIILLFIIPINISIANAGWFSSNQFDFKKEDDKSISELISEVDSSVHKLDKELFAGIGMIIHLTSLSGSEYTSFINKNNRFFNHYRDLDQEEINNVLRSMIIYIKYYGLSLKYQREWLSNAIEHGVFPKSISYSTDYLKAQKFLSSFKGFTAQHNQYKQMNDAAQSKSGVAISELQIKKMSNIFLQMANAVGDKEYDAIRGEMKQFVAQVINQ